MNVPVPDWDQLAAIGNHSLVRSSYIWLLVVPMGAKAMTLIENPLDFTHLVPGLMLNLELPFSWIVFYFSAVFISLGNFFFQRMCPEIVLKYPAMNIFLNDGRDMEYLKETSERWGIWAGFKTAIGQFNQSTPEDRQRALAKTFWLVRDYANSSKEVARGAVAIHLLTGIGLLGWILGQNFLFVIHQLQQA